MPDITAPVVPAVPAPAAPAAPPEAKADAPKAPKADAPKDAPKAPAPKADAQAKDVQKEVAKQLHKLVIDGKEEEVDLDELVKRAQLATAANKRFQEASQAKKDAQEQVQKVSAVLKMMKEDPGAFAKEAKALGVDPEELATKMLEPILREQIAAEEEKLLSPEQKKQKDLERKLQEYERQEKERKDAEAKKAEDARKAAYQQEVDKHKNDFAAIIKEALTKTSLPQTPETAIALTQLLREAKERGLPLKAETLAKDLEAQERARLSGLLKANLGGAKEWLPAELIQKIRETAVDDPKLAEAIRKKAVAEFKKSNPMAAAKPVVSKDGVEKPREAKKGKSMNSIFKELGLQAASGKLR